MVSMCAHWVFGHVSGPRTNQNAENVEATEGNDCEGQQQHYGERNDRDLRSVQDRYTSPAETQQPYAADTDISDPDTWWLLQPPVGDWVNYSQVALHTGQDVEAHLCRKNHICKIEGNKN